MRPDTRALRYFVAVAEELHFGRAAVRLNITQPPLSQQIRLLEEQFGCLLLERSQRRVALTPEGRALLQHVRPLLAQLDEAPAVVRAAARGESGRLRIGYTAVCATTLLPRVMQAFKSRYPLVEIELHEALSGRQLEAIRELRLDVGLLRPQTWPPGVSAELLCTDTLQVVMPAAHRLVQHHTVRIEDLAQEPLIGYERAQAVYFHDLIDGLFQRAGVVPLVVQRATQPATLMGLVAAGFGIALVPTALGMVLAEGVVGRPLLAEPAVRSEIHICWRPDQHTALLANFRACAQAVCRETNGH